MATMIGDCGVCGTSTDMAVTQSVWDGTIVWSRSYKCPYCGRQVEEDGYGSTAAEIRAAILEQEGAWCVIVEETDVGVAAALKLLKDALELSMPEVAQLRKRLPGVVFDGTKAETSRLMSILTVGGISARTVRMGT